MIRASHLHRRTSDPRRARRLVRCAAEALETRYFLSRLPSHGDEQLSASVFVQPKSQVTSLDVPLADQAESEPNNTAAAANAASVSSTPNIISAAIGSGTDLDYYSFTLASRSGVFFDIDSREAG